jgi:hypothetical protein
MLDSDTISRLNVKAQALVDRCKTIMAPPHRVLEEGLEELATQPNWSQAEIEQMRRAVKRLIDDIDDRQS